MISGDKDSKVGKPRVGLVIENNKWRHKYTANDYKYIKKNHSFQFIVTET